MFLNISYDQRARQISIRVDWNGQTPLQIIIAQGRNNQKTANVISALLAKKVRQLIIERYTCFPFTLNIPFWFPGPHSANDVRGWLFTKNYSRSNEPSILHHP